MKVAIYCRLSEEDRDKQTETDDSVSIQNQKSMLMAHAMENSWEIYDIYSDDDYAGADRNRPEFIRLLADAQMCKFNIVLCKSQSRFTREMELVEKYIHGLFPVWNIRFVSIVDNADTANPGNKKSRQINGLVNEWFLEDLSNNVKKTLTDRREKGYHVGAFALYGYQKDPDSKGHLIVDPEAAEIVREIFTLFVQGYGKTAIARMLNDRGIPNPTEYKRQKGLRYKQPKSKQSTLWKYYAISNMLTNEIYIGNMVQGKYGSVSYKTKQNKPRAREQWIKVENTHEPIISKQLWGSVQELISERAKPFSTGNIGLFARKVRCMNCGYIMRSSKSHGRHYLKCGTRYAAENACVGSFVSVEVLENAVLDELQLMVNNYLDKGELERQVQFTDNIAASIKKVESEIAVYEKKNAEQTKLLKELYVDKVKGIIPEEEFVTLSREFSRERERLQQNYNETKKQLEILHKKVETVDDHNHKIQEYMTLEKLDRETVIKLIDFILVGRRTVGTRQIPIEIHWNF